MRRFYLERAQDPSGVSGTGRVAEGIEFTHGWVALTWLTALGFTGVAIYPSMCCVEQVHGHNGSTKIVFIDGAAPDVVGGEDFALVGGQS
jgi:hypothetical protein